jgi:Ca2+-binding RTX toxin-like protein
MSNYLSESANTDNMYAKGMQITEALSKDETLTQAQRDEARALYVELVNDGGKLIEALASFINKYAEVNELKELKSLKIGSKVIAPVVDLVVNKEDLMKVIVTSLISKGTGYAVGLATVAAATAVATAPYWLIAAGGVAVGYVVDETLGEAVKEGYDYVFGPSVTMGLIGGNKTTIYIESVTGSSQNIFRHHWDTLKNMTEWRIYTVNQKERYGYVQETNTLTVNQNVTNLIKLDSSFIDLMKNYISKASGEANTPIVVANGENLGKAYNYFHKDIHALTQFGNQRDIYALVALRPVVFETHDKNAYEAIKLDDYSTTYIEKRSQMLYYVINPQSQTSGDAIYFKDVATNIETYTRQSGVVYTSKVLFGKETDDNDTVLNGSSGDDFIFGMGGNDTLEGNAGNDYLEGGKGQDSLKGGDGNDTYFFKKGDGSDAIEDTPVGSSDDSKADVLLFGEGINPEDLHVYANGENLIVDIKNTSDIITIKDWYTKENRIEYFEFADGAKLGIHEILDLMSTDEADTVKGIEEGHDFQTGKGDDTLISNIKYNGEKVNDILEGGDGFDTYLVDGGITFGDIINDSDRKGKVEFQGIDLTGQKTKEKDSNLYKDDDGFTYEEQNGKLIVTKGTESITIKNWENKALGIELVDNKDIEVSITESANASEGDSGKRSLYFTVTLSRVLEEGETLEVSVSNTDEGTYTFTSGEQSKTFTHSWSGDTQDEGAIDHRATLTPSASYEGFYDDVKVVIKNSGTAIVYDDDSILPDPDGGGNEDFSSPLVLDLNGNKTTSTFLTDSQTYFDTDNDGFKERTSWIESSDGLLALDLNGDGIINNGSELFGNNTKLANGTTAKNANKQFQTFTLTNLLTCKDFHTTKSLHVRIKIKQKGVTHGAQPKAA